jgi:hypothetical protein
MSQPNPVYNPSSHLRLGLLSVLFLSGSPHQNLTHAAFLLIHATCPAHLILGNELYSTKYLEKVRKYLLIKNKFTARS